MFSGGARACRIEGVHLGISARSAAVAAIVVFCALTVAGAGLDAILYRSLLSGVDYAAAERVRDIAKALQSDSREELDNALLTTDQRVVATQLIGPDGSVVKRSGSAPATPLVPTADFDFTLRRGLPDDAVSGDDMRVSGQKVATRSGVYTVLVGGGSEAVEATARTLAILLATTAPVIVAVAAGATYWLVRRSLKSVDAIRARVADISASDLAERVPVPDGRDEIAALAVTMNEMLSRLEAGHRAQQRFVGDASHELRSPLTTIISGLEVAEAHPELLDAELAVNTLLPEAHRMRALIDDLLLLARADERNLLRRKEPVALDDLAEAEAARVRRDADCAVHTDIRPARLLADPTAMTRMIRNLVDNAVRHAVSCVAIEVGSRDGTAVLTVGDDGPGIPPAQRSRVFERFVRLDTDRARSGGGAGLGLAIVAEVVAAHGGTVTIGDRPGGGTTLTVALPQHPAQHSSR
ncbi:MULTISPECIES: HAMP domain-containing sensor histidine kinase [Mycobacterium avium complex (MAC)]|uniref:histidine kinase n=5 Tax=Mycobacterium avium TaxID=1764 RepID=Q741I9_MYCPA|nr:MULTISPECIES: ATP-binding protein [Mycobacterium avium complex (MAC)]ETB02555.1 histidine kinase [Mycobacterium avium subsp. paratuberculosis 10-4404]ETB02633.1 histidine kinase [Mycobacterium avium subsp. paratuberculosis 10-5864]ETB10670.1 histidine kinase [Mycobacterium avium subsp. paratuberculosis 08-8281]ETB30568.1 histidine kinase [Mycobacterium avium subsp. paratuberculosis 10-5975]ETB37829.1 histidine kinase [Mycobacterium avium subsp. paratuberculosis 11-1786]ETB51586.1 histidine